MRISYNYLEIDMATFGALVIYDIEILKIVTCMGHGTFRKIRMWL